MNPSTANMIIKLIDLVLLGVEVLPHIKASYEYHKKVIQEMIDSGREPTAEEWEVLISEVAALSDQIQQA